MPAATEKPEALDWQLGLLTRAGEGELFSIISFPESSSVESDYSVSFFSLIGCATGLKSGLRLFLLEINFDIFAIVISVAFCSGCHY